MDANRIDELADGLRGEEQRLLNLLTELQGRQAAVSADLKRVRSALAGLTAKGARKRDREAAHGLTLAEVQPFIAALLQQHGPLPAAEIKERLAAEAQQQARTRSGLHLLVKRALLAGPFAQQGEAWGLDDTTSSPARPGGE